MSGFKLSIRNQQKTLALDLKVFKKFLSFVLENEWEKFSSRHALSLGDGTFEWSFSLIEEKEMVQLHEKSHQLKTPTDVISFGYLEDLASFNDGCVLGEIFVSTDEAVKQSPKYKKTPESEVLLYAVHGLLHIFGYDDLTPQDRVEMKKREKFYMEVFEISFRDLIKE